MTGDDHQNLGAPDVPDDTSADPHRGAPGTAHPPAHHSPRAPGAAAVLTEVTQRLQTMEQLGDEPRASGERHWHLELLNRHLWRCRRGGLPYRNALIGIAVQAVLWAAAIEDRS